MLLFPRGIRSTSTTKYSTNSQKLEYVDSFNDLGGGLEQKLRFNLHIEFSLNKAKSYFIKPRWKTLHYVYKCKKVIIELRYPFYRCCVDSMESMNLIFLKLSSVDIIMSFWRNLNDIYNSIFTSDSLNFIKAIFFISLYFEGMKNLKFYVVPPFKTTKHGTNFDQTSPI